MYNEGVFRKMIGSMNSHLPATRKTLTVLLMEESPSYQGKDGNIYHIDREELEYIASLLDEQEAERLRIPIYISTDTSYPGGAWKVEGTVEVKLVSQVVGRHPETKGSIRLFHPHLRDLRKRLPDSTTAMYLP